MNASKPNRISMLLAPLLFAVAACHDLRYVTDDGGADASQNCPDCDMADASLACIAAKGLTGTPLVCVDFGSNISLSDLKMSGWNFDKTQPSCPTTNVWGVQGGVLQVQDFTNFGMSGAGTCGFATPPIPSNNLASYRSVTLFVQHVLDLNDPDQTAKIFYNTTAPGKLLWKGTGSHQVARQQTSITLNISDIPMADRGADFLWVFTLTSQNAYMMRGWQIESIAVVGHP